MGDATFEQELFGRLVRATRLSNTLPAPGDDLEFCATFPGFRQAQAGLRGRLARMIGAVLSLRGAQPPAGAAADDEWYERVVDASDGMLEAAETAYDGARGVSNTTHHSIEGGTAAGARGAGSTAHASGTAVAAQHKQLLRPQLRWKTAVDNSDAPFVPKLTSKPNALVPLDEAMAYAVAAASATGGECVMAVQRPSEGPGGPGAPPSSDPHAARAAALRAHASALGLVGAAAGDGSTRSGALGPNAAGAYTFGHPYDAELAAFAPSAEQLRVRAEQLYRPLHETPCEWVDDEASLERMLEHLSGHDEIALDVEHHSLHSYRGFSCLLQISSRERDYLVDALELRDGLGALNELLTDPRVTKVLHGSDSDVIWLQRDLGLYLVGLFDTGQAARALGLESAGLSFVLRYYCGVHADKKLQLADWRQRPLTAEMAAYARADTHYLLYVKDRLVKALAEHDEKARRVPGAPDSLTRAVWDRSTALARQCYRVEPFDPASHLALLRKVSTPLTPAQVGVHRELFAWRDALARELDESPGAVLPAFVLVHLAANVPTSAHAVLSAWEGRVRSPIPALVRARAGEIGELIARALDGGGGGGGGDGGTRGGARGARREQPQPQRQPVAAEAADGAVVTKARQGKRDAAPVAPRASMLDAAPRAGRPARVAPADAALASAQPAMARAWHVAPASAVPSILALHLLGASATVSAARPASGRAAPPGRHAACALASTCEEAPLCALAAEMHASFVTRPQWRTLRSDAQQQQQKKMDETEEMEMGMDENQTAPRTAAAAPAASAQLEDARAAAGRTCMDGYPATQLSAAGAAPAGRGHDAVESPSAFKKAASSATPSSLVARYGHAHKAARAERTDGGAGAGAHRATPRAPVESAADDDGGGIGARAADFMRTIGWLAPATGGGEQPRQAADGAQDGGARPPPAGTAAGKRAASDVAEHGAARGEEGEQEREEGSGEDAADDFWTSPSHLPAAARARGRGGGRGRGGAADGRGEKRQRPAGPRNEPRNAPGPIKRQNQHKGRSASFK
ncbi:hypothetical protein KFE25_009288 [Diacronema lutheri]|uniref:HRDC domain-containing protein n=1 Tax=Diacronema lutheri TaxID=2081491 RepID=A0A8J5XYK3_DIALT|nr:hypothetical protein KFE25_009288 [Diacronema lutheri]